MQIKNSNYKYIKRKLYQHMSHERNPYSNVTRTPARCNAIDTHELLKTEIYRQGHASDTNFRFGVNVSAPISGGSPGGLSPGQVGFEDWELYFDSVYKNSAISDLPNGVIGFPLATLNNNKDLKNVIQMTLMPFYFPRITNPRVQLNNVLYPSLALTTNSPDYFFFRRMYIQVVNMPFGQAVQANNSVQYHWECGVENTNSVAVLLNPLKQSFFLQRPLQTLSEIQFRFMVPLDFRAVPIPVETLPVQLVLPLTNPARFRILNTPNGSEAMNLLIPPAIIQNQAPPDPAQIPIPAIAPPGIAVFMSGAVLTNGGVSNLLVEQLVNGVNGLFITAVINTQPANLPPQYVFEVNDINPTLGAPAITASNVFVMVVAYRRIAFPIRFTCVKDQLTNYITVSHE
jgi:hypothetical protein